LLAGVLPYWAIRFVVRREAGAVKTGIIVNLVISIVATTIYLLFFPIITSTLGVSENYVSLYLLIAIQIIEIYSLNMLTACLRGKMPHVVGYGLLIHECCKVILGFTLIILLKQALIGAILSIIIATGVQIIYYITLLREEFKQTFKLEYVKEWLKGSIANIYNVVGRQIAAFVFILLFTYGGEGARSNYGVAAQIANVITYSTSLTFALYPRLLAERKPEDITSSFKTILMFAIPMTLGIITLSDSYIIIMNIIYREAWPILITLAINSFIKSVSGIFGSILAGFERLDEKTKISFRGLIKSRLFIAFSLPYIQSVITLPAAIFTLMIYTQNDPLQAAFNISLIITITSLITCLILYRIARKIVKIDFPWSNAAKYVFASAIMVLALYLIPHPTTLILTLGITSIGGTIYLTSLIAVDKESRTLILTVWEEIKNKVM
jgi:O-antigen/teichoic acid export membrane protein